MNPSEAILLATELAMGFALSATCGLRAFLPLFVAGMLARFTPGWVVLGPSFAWLASTPALIVFGAACAIELVGDKFPAVDHVLDAAGMIIKPLAATLCAASVFTHVNPVLGAVLGLATGGVAAGAVHLVKTKTRLASSLFTAGFGNPVLSTLEDGAAIVSIAFAVLVPLFAAVAIAGLFMSVAAIILLRRSRRAPRPAVAI